MNVLIKILAFVTAILVSGCAFTNHIPRNYAGHDAGVLIVGLGATPETKYSSYMLRFRRKGVPAEGRIMYLQFNSVATPRDFDDQFENGIIDIQKLPPGDYEIFNFNIHLNGGFFEKSYQSRTDFSIPFKIISGKATYIGDFAAVHISGKNILGMRIDGGAYFVLSDKQQRDIPIAKRKMPSLSDIEVAVPDATSIGTPFIQPRLPESG